MTTFLQFTGPVQTKLWQYCHSFAGDFSKPAHKFVHQMLFGILKSGSAQLNSIGRALQEKIALKKITQRLGAHLDKTGLWQLISAATLKAQASRLQKCVYAIFDLSDISKRYAKKMAGLATVYDGSEGTLASGYWLMNVSAIDKTASTIVPVYSELFSHQVEATSENHKILAAVRTVLASCPADIVSVFDRGGDRLVLMHAFLGAERQFIIRQRGDRHLYADGEKRPLKTIAQQAKLKWTYKVERVHNNKVKTLLFAGGAVPVRLFAEGNSLWLVILKERHRGYCWLLCYFHDCQAAREAVRRAVEGYGVRFKIEEVHRQIKGDYRLEAICLQRYEALKSMNALVWMAASFLYTRLEPLALNIIMHPELGLVNRKKIKDLLRFIYYKLALAVKKIMAVARLYDPRKIPKQSQQLALALIE